MSHYTFNHFLIDDERRIALRDEIKRKLAELAVKRTRVDELDIVIARVNRDSDDAAAEHRREYDPLQSELAALDQKHVDAILKGEQVTDKITKRRSEILERIRELDQARDMRTEANRRALEPLNKQKRELQHEVGQEGVLRNNLIDLSSPALRHRSRALEFIVRSLRAAVDECDRMASVYDGNLSTVLDPETRRGQIEQAKAVDLEAMKRHIENELHRAMADQQEIQRKRLTE
jgi:hypothetical protein